MKTYPIPRPVASFSCKIHGTKCPWKNQGFCDEHLGPAPKGSSTFIRENWKRWRLEELQDAGLPVDTEELNELQAGYDRKAAARYQKAMRRSSLCPCGGNDGEPHTRAQCNGRG